MNITPKITQLRMASYNIRKTRGLDGNRDPYRSLKIITSLGADIVALQEADRRLGKRPAAIDRKMIEAETDYKVLDVAQNEVSLGWHGNAILLRKNIAVRNISHITLPGFEPRGAVRMDIDAPVPVSVVAVHLGLTRRHRRQQLHAITKHLNGTKRAIILGDFNEWSSKRGFEALNDKFDVHSPGHSFHAARPVAALDRIALSQGIELKDAGVDQSALARVASDHLPIWADVEMDGHFGSASL